MMVTIYIFSYLVLLAALVYPTTCQYIANCREMTYSGECVKCDPLYHINSKKTCSIDIAIQILAIMCCMCCCSCLGGITAQFRSWRQQQLVRQRQVAQGNYTNAGNGVNSNPDSLDQIPVSTERRAGGSLDGDEPRVISGPQNP